jgi:hypothetical protein
MVILQYSVYCKVVCVCTFVVAEDHLSFCGCYAVAHIVAVLAPNMKFVFGGWPLVEFVTEGPDLNPTVRYWV